VTSNKYKKYIDKMIKRRSFLLSKRFNGAILIEFAFAVPVIVILLYYINDLTRIKQYYRSSEFVAHQIAGMI